MLTVLNEYIMMMNITLYKRAASEASPSGSRRTASVCRWRS